MRFKNPFKHLEPEYEHCPDCGTEMIGDSSIEMMQSAFWTMLAFMFAQWFTITLVTFLMTHQELLDNVCKTLTQ